MIKFSGKSNNYAFIINILILIAIFYILLTMPRNKGGNEHFVSGENAYMEPEFNYYFSKCLQSYPIAFRGPVNDGYYTCLRKTEAALKNLGQGCEFCYNKDN